MRAMCLLRVRAGAPRPELAKHLARVFQTDYARLCCTSLAPQGGTANGKQKVAGQTFKVREYVLPVVAMWSRVIAAV